MKTQQRVWLIISVIIFLLGVYVLRSVLSPFLFAAVLAYLGDPLVRYLMRLKISRTLAATIVFIFIMLLVSALLFFLIPLLIRQVIQFINRLPEILAWVQTLVLPWINQHFNYDLSFDLPDLRTILSQHWQQAGNIAAKTWQIFSHSGVVLLAWFAKLLLIPVVTFYLLRDWVQVVDNTQRLLPRRYEPTVSKITRECNNILGAFLRGQLLVMLGLACIYTIGLAISGLDFALLIGSLAGLLSIVPYLGVIIGVGTAVIAALMQYHDSIHLIYVVIVFVIGHIAEHFVLTPWLVGDRIGLHPVAVIFAILAGGHLFGFTGILLGLPIAAVIMVLLRHLRKHYVKSELYQ